MEYMAEKQALDSVNDRGGNVGFCGPLSAAAGQFSGGVCLVVEEGGRGGPLNDDQVYFGADELAVTPAES